MANENLSPRASDASSFRRGHFDAARLSRGESCAGEERRCQTDVHALRLRWKRPDCLLWGGGAHRRAPGVKSRSMFVRRI